MDSQKKKKIHKYFYILGYDKYGVYLDSFYKVKSQANSVEEAQVMAAIGDDKELHNNYRDSQAMQGLKYRSRFTKDKLRIMTSEESMTRNQFEEFLKIEHKHNPNSRWLK